MRRGRRDALGRGAFILFCGIVLVAVLQIAWWIIFLLGIAPERRYVVMFASEGAFFMLALMAGVFLMYRTLVEQVRLKEARSTFLSAVTHELKSPLASLRLFLETIEEGRVGPEKRSDLVKKMLFDVDRLERLVRDLLRAGQIEARALEPALEKVDLGALAREAVERARPRLEEGDRIEVDSEISLCARGDRDLLASAIENLIDNAIKYSPPPRRIEVRLAPRGLVAEVEIWDEGIGLGPGLASRAFEPFERAGDEETRRTKGTGLGLFIVRGIAEAHGGRAWIGPRPDGRRGTAAGFYVPAGKP
jgi:signal transduction histidine kinase